MSYFDLCCLFVSSQLVSSIGLTALLFGRSNLIQLPWEKQIQCKGVMFEKPIKVVRPNSTDAASLDETKKTTTIITRKVDISSKMSVVITFWSDPPMWNF